MVSYDTVAAVPEGNASAEVVPAKPRLVVPSSATLTKGYALDKARPATEDTVPLAKEPKTWYPVASVPAYDTPIADTMLLKGVLGGAVAKFASRTDDTVHPTADGIAVTKLALTPVGSANPAVTCTAPMAVQPAGKEKGSTYDEYCDQPSVALLVHPAPPHMLVSVGV